MGEPGGIGPETIIKAYEKQRSRIETSDLRLLITGSGSALKNATAQLEEKPDISDVRADKERPHFRFRQADDEGEPIRRRVLSADSGRFREGRGAGRPADPAGRIGVS